VDLRHVLAPTLSAVFVLMLVFAVAYRCRLRQALSHVRPGTEKKVPPAGGDREVTLVLTDVQVSRRQNVQARLEGLHIPAYTIPGVSASGRQKGL
jgi:hypothetical protein